jgi:hypothetical protein
MISIILAALLGASIYFSMQGVVFATNFLIAFLMLNVTLITYSIVVTNGLQRTLLLNAEDRIEQLDKRLSKRDVPVIILLRLFTLLCVIHIYSLGYYFFAGIAGIVTAISILVIFLQALDMPSNMENEE